jgi:uroporphyrinogen-III synthase
MNAPIFVVRPLPAGLATVDAGRPAGLTIEASPLSEIEPAEWTAPDPAQIDALLLGSANVARHAGAGLALFRGKPAYVVGPATAAAAQAAGFGIAAVGRGGLQAVLDSAVRPPLRLLRLAGEEHVHLSPPLGVIVETRVVYRSAPLAMPPALAERLRNGALVLLHSAAAARHFAAECDRCGVPRSAVSLAALGPRIAAAAGEGWRAVRSASVPAEPALLALARDMCHESPSG